MGAMKLAAQISCSYREWNIASRKIWRLQASEVALERAIILDIRLFELGVMREDAGWQQADLWVLIRSCPGGGLTTAR